MASLLIAGTAFNYVEWPDAEIRPALTWKKRANGFWRACDDGAAQDAYEAEATLVLKQVDMDSLQSVMQANREGITLSGFATEFFAPNVNHSGSISATIIDPGARAHRAFAYTGGGVHEVTLRFRALSPTLVSATPSLATLRLQKGWSGDQTWDICKGITYGQAAKYSDRRADTGFFIGQFLQTTTEMQAILAYLLTTARASAFTLPTFPSVTYPFGINRGGGSHNCKAKSFRFSRVSPTRWSLEIEFREAP